MDNASRFIAQFFPLFLLGALFGKLMEDSGSVAAIASFMTEKLGPQRAVLTVVLAGALVTYGGVSLFVAFFVLVPMAQALFRTAADPQPVDSRRRWLWARPPLRCRRCPERRPSRTRSRCRFLARRRWPHRVSASSLPRSCWLSACGGCGTPQTAARRKGEGFGAAAPVPVDQAAEDETVRQRATTAREFDPPEVHHGHPSREDAADRLGGVAAAGGGQRQRADDAGRSAEPRRFVPRRGAVRRDLALRRWRRVVGGDRAAAAIVTVIAVNWRRLRGVRETMDSGANASVLPVLSVASLVGFGAVVAAVPAFAIVRNWVLSIGGGPLVSLAVATNLLSALTGSASGGLTIALEALGATYMRLAAAHGIDPALLHRIAVMSAGTLDSLPQNGAVVTLLSVCGSTHRESYFDIVMAVIVGPIIALAVVIAARLFLRFVLGSRLAIDVTYRLGKGGIMRFEGMDCRGGIGIAGAERGACRDRSEFQRKHDGRSRRALRARHPTTGSAPPPSTFARAISRAR